MTAAVAALILAAEVSALPEGSVRYRVEIAGVKVGTSEISLIHETQDRYALRWQSWLRFPYEAGGGLLQRKTEATVDLQGQLLGLARVKTGGAIRRVRGPPGAVPLALAELVLASRGGGCTRAWDEESGRVGQACARLGFEGHGGEIETFEVLGVSEEVRLGSDGFPDEVTVAAQATRFVRNPSSSVPVEPPRLEVRVAGPPAGRSARRFCGRAPDISVASGVALPTSGASARRKELPCAGDRLRQGSPPGGVEDPHRPGRGSGWSGICLACLGGGAGGRRLAGRRPGLRAVTSPRAALRRGEASRRRQGSI